jgi:hypothetical protein
MPASIQLMSASHRERDTVACGEGDEVTKDQLVGKEVNLLSLTNVAVLRNEPGERFK